MDYHGYPYQEVSNGFLRIGYLRAGALRLVRLLLGDNPTNLFVEVPEEGWQTPHGWYPMIGGHRFWVAPECMEITYLPEAGQVEEQVVPDGIRLIQSLDVRSGLQRIIELRLDPDTASFTLRHELLNLGEKAVTAAAWAISQFPLGGIAALPQPDTWVDVSGLLPNRSLALWPYTRLNDPRLRWMENYLMVNAQQIKQPCKVGCSGQPGWGVYLVDGVLIRKRVVIQSGAQYPDLNSALEIYIDHRFLELESLSPLTCLAPGERIVHQEHWSLEAVSGIGNELALAEYLGG